MKEPRIVAAGPDLTYARRVRRMEDPDAPRRIWDMAEEFAEDALPAIASMLGDALPQDVVMEYAAMSRDTWTGQPNSAAALVAYLLVRCVQNESITPDAARFRPDSTGEDTPNE